MNESSLDPLCNGGRQDRERDRGEDELPRHEQDRRIGAVTGVEADPGETEIVEATDEAADVGAERERVPGETHWTETSANATNESAIIAIRFFFLTIPP